MNPEHKSSSFLVFGGRGFCRKNSKCLVVSENTRKVCHRLSPSASFPNLSPSLDTFNPPETLLSQDIPACFAPTCSVSDLLPLHIPSCMSLDTVL